MNKIKVETDVVYGAWDALKDFRGMLIDREVEDTEYLNELVIKLREALDNKEE